MRQEAREFEASLGHNLKKKKNRSQWLTPVILATQETEIRRIMVGSQPGQTVHKTLSRENTSQK
jgi:hypothetical protein